MLIFLDIDGVLRRTGAPLYVLEDGCRSSFEQAIRGLPDAKVVISSSWREGFSIDEIRAHFSDDVAARIIGVTPMAQSLDGHRRFHEIQAYLRHSGKPEAWVAIDDTSELFPDGCNLVLVEGARGFDADAARRLLEACGGGSGEARA